MAKCLTFSSLVPVFQKQHGVVTGAVGMRADAGGMGFFQRAEGSRIIAFQASSCPVTGLFDTEFMKENTVAQASIPENLVP